MNLSKTNDIMLAIRKFASARPMYNSFTLSGQAKHVYYSNVFSAFFKYLSSNNSIANRVANETIIVAPFDTST